MCAEEDRQERDPADPEHAQPSGELVGAGREVAEGVARVGPVRLDQPQRGTFGMLGGEHAVEPVDREVEVLRARPAKPGAGRRVVGAVLLEEVAGVAELVDRGHAPTLAWCAIVVTKSLTARAT